MKTSETISSIAKALIAMQGAMSPAKKGSVNPFFKSSYADLVSIWASIRELLLDHNLCVVQDALTLPEGISVCTRIIHESGEYFEFGPLVMPVSKDDAQAVGSAISYGKRYALGAALGIVAEKDDDGNRAVKAAPKKAEETRKIPSVNKDLWIEKWSGKYDLSELEQYIKARAEHKNHSVETTVNELAFNEKVFEENFCKWQDQEKIANPLKS